MTTSVTLTKHDLYKEDPIKGFLLYVKDVSVKLSGFELLIPKFALLGSGVEVVIGGNGAGKTTLCDVISGKTRVTTGSVYFKGSEVTRLSETEIARRGVGRKFQTPAVFNSLTVYQNMELALPGRTGLLRNIWRRTDDEERDRIEDGLAGLKLLELRQTPAGALSHGQRQWLELAMLTLSDPALLLVDEPAAGLTPNEVEDTVQHLLHLGQKHALLVIEHNMDFVRKLGSHVTCLHRGKILEDGPFEKIESSEKVKEAYLGGGDAC